MAAQMAGDGSLAAVGIAEKKMVPGVMVDRGSITSNAKRRPLSRPPPLQFKPAMPD
jgi:hypothetical protein